MIENETMALRTMGGTERCEAQNELRKRNEGGSHSFLTPTVPHSNMGSQAMAGYALPPVSASQPQTEGPGSPASPARTKNEERERERERRTTTKNENENEEKNEDLERA